jgi:hypothetical protein
MTAKGPMPGGERNEMRLRPRPRSLANCLLLKCRPDDHLLGSNEPEARGIELTAAQPALCREEASVGTEELPDPAFLLLARLASNDVANSLLVGRAEAMHGPVREAIWSAG